MVLYPDPLLHHTKYPLAEKCTYTTMVCTVMGMKFDAGRKVVLFGITAEGVAFSILQMDVFS
jgi:hypothetical protein